MPVNALILSDMRTCIHFARGISHETLQLKNDKDDEDDDNYIT